MFHQPSSLQSDRDEKVLNLGWPGPLLPNQTRIYRNPPVDPYRMPCRVFLGPNPNNLQYADLENLLKEFDNTRFSGLELTTYPSSFSQDQRRDIHRLIVDQVTGQVEWRTVQPTTGLERVTKWIVHPEGRLVSSALSIPIDSFSKLLEHEVYKLCELKNMELVHLLPPMSPFDFGPASIHPYKNALETLLGRYTLTPSLRKCILPLDFPLGLFDCLAQALEVLKSHVALQEIELTYTINEGNLRRLQGGLYEPLMTRLPPLLSQLTRLEALTIPIPFVSDKTVAHIAILPFLVTLTVVPVVPVNSVKHLLEALGAALIRKKGPGCFERLTCLDLGPGNPQPLNAPGHSTDCRELCAIFVDTDFRGDWLKWL